MTTFPSVPVAGECRRGDGGVSGAAEAQRLGRPGCLCRAAVVVLRYLGDALSACRCPAGLITARGNAMVGSSNQTRHAHISVAVAMDVKTLK